MQRCITAPNVEQTPENTPRKRPRVYGYVRVSTDEQARTGISLEAQRERIENYCRTEGLELVRIFADAGESGENLDRPGLADLCYWGGGWGSDGVVVAKLDRLTRRVRDWLQLVGSTFRGSKRIWVVGAGVADTQTAIGRFMLLIQIGMAEWELDTIHERTDAAMNHKRSKGERLGTVPYGWTVADDGKTLVMELGEQRTIAGMLRDRALGLSFAAIANELNADQVPTKRGGPWRASTVASVLKRAAKEPA